MKTIATVIASLMLSLGMLTSPVHADEPAPAPATPASCDEIRAYAADLETKYAEMNTRYVDEIFANSARAEEDRALIKQYSDNASRLTRRVHRQEDKIAELRKKLRKARQN